MSVALDGVVFYSVEERPGMLTAQNPLILNATH
jgi:hypothetical protein